VGQNYVLALWSNAATAAAATAPGGSDSSSGGVFRDVTKGSNGGYQAGVGWDAATGWGSMNGRKLLEALCPGFVSRPALMMF